MLSSAPGESARMSSLPSAPEYVLPQQLANSRDGPALLRARGVRLSQRRGRSGGGANLLRAAGVPAACGHPRRHDAAAGAIRLGHSAAEAAPPRKLLARHLGIY